MQDIHGMLCDLILKADACGLDPHKAIEVLKEFRDG